MLGREKVDERLAFGQNYEVIKCKFNSKFFPNLFLNQSKSVFMLSDCPESRNFIKCTPF